MRFIAAVSILIVCWIAISISSPIEIENEFPNDAADNDDLLISRSKRQLLGGRFLGGGGGLLGGGLLGQGAGFRNYYGGNYDRGGYGNNR